MQRPGRNDPCYCGSGKKYKQCHMAADLSADNDVRLRQDAARFLRGDLAEFAGESRFDAEIDKALPAYWNEYYTAENDHLMSMSESERFFDWFVFDHALEDGRRIVAVYSEERGEKLNSAQREVLAAWLKAGPMTAYEFVGHDGQTLQLKEYLTGDAAAVYAPMGHGQMPIGALILTRLLPVAERMEFGVLPAYIPPEEVADLRQKLDAARATDGQSAAGGQSAAADFLRRHNTIYIHHALEQAKLAGRPPVERLDPRHIASGVPHRARHDQKRVKGPGSNPAETMPHQSFRRQKV